MFLLSRHLRPFLFFTVLAGVIFSLYHVAFSIDFFLDDFFFLTLGHAQRIGDFLHFFSPFKDYFYRPLPTEVFYLFINSTGQNLFLSHLVVFCVFFIGLLFLFLTLFTLTKKEGLSYLITFFYAINFTHVFQLYQLAAGIEVALFTFLTGSFYFFCKKHYLLSVFLYLLALLSKETAALFPLFLLGYTFVRFHSARFRYIQPILVFLFCAGVFVVLYKIGTTQVIVHDDTYQLQANPRLIVNNTMWYVLWSLGLPNFTPNYVKSVLLQPLPEFWQLINTSLSIRWYFILLGSFSALFTLTLGAYLFRFAQKRRNIALLFLFSLGGFLLFILPTLPIIHRWMVRLTVPLLFIVCFEAYILSLFFKQQGIWRYIGVVLVLLYVSYNYLGVGIHESSGLFLRGSHMTIQTRAAIQAHKQAIIQKQILYFQDPLHTGVVPPSMDLKNNLGDQHFLSQMLPGSSVHAVYGFAHPQIPKDAYILPAAPLVQ